MGRTYTNEQLLDGKWVDWNQIVGNDGQVVVVDPESETGPDSAVDQFQYVFLPRSKCCVEVVLRVLAAVIMTYAIDEYTVTGRRWVARTVCHFGRVGDKCRLVNPIRDHDGTQIDIPVRTGRPVDDKRTGHAVRVLVVLGVSVISSVYHGAKTKTRNGTRQT